MVYGQVTQQACSTIDCAANAHGRQARGATGRGADYNVNPYSFFSMMVHGCMEKRRLVKDRRASGHVLCDFVNAILTHCAGQYTSLTIPAMGGQTVDVNLASARIDIRAWWQSMNAAGLPLERRYSQECVFSTLLTSKEVPTVGELLAWLLVDKELSLCPLCWSAAKYIIHQVTHMLMANLEGLAVPESAVVHERVPQKAIDKKANCYCPCSQLSLSVSTLASHSSIHPFIQSVIHSCHSWSFAWSARRSFLSVVSVLSVLPVLSCRLCLVCLVLSGSFVFVSSVSSLFVAHCRCLCCLSIYLSVCLCLCPSLSANPSIHAPR